MTLVLILPALRCLRTRNNFQINGCKLGFHKFGNHWERFPCLHGIIQVIKGMPFRSHSAFPPCCSLITRSKNPWRLKFSCASPKKKRKGLKAGGAHKGLANSRSTAVISQPAWSHHTAHLRSAPRAAGPAPGCCRRRGQAGRTLSQSPPPRPAAPRSRQQCPARQPCPRTPWGEYFLEGLCGESSGQTRGGKTRGEGNENTPGLRLISNSLTTFMLCAQIS